MCIIFLVLMCFVDLYFIVIDEDMHTTQYLLCSEEFASVIQAVCEEYGGIKLSYPTNEGRIQ